MKHPVVIELFEEMARRKVTSAMLGRMSGVSYETIRCWNTGKSHSPHFNKLAKAWAALGYDIVLVKRQPDLKVVKG